MTAYLKIIWRNIVTNIKILAKISFLLFIIFAAYIGNTVFFPQKIPPQYQITVNKGQNLSNLAVVLKEDKIIKNKKIFLFILRFLNG